MEANWIIIFKLKDFNAYLSTSELIQLSMGCKKFRNLLNITACMSFNFVSFVESNTYKSYAIDEFSTLSEAGNNVNDREEYEYNSNNEDEDENGSENSWADVLHLQNPYKPLTEEFIESKNRFSSDLNLYKSQPKHLLLHLCKDYYYLLCSIPSIFSKLSLLVITNSHIKVEIFQHLLDSLVNLESLEFSRSYLLQYSPSYKQSSIKWPTSLTKLKFTDNYASFIKDQERPVILYEGEIKNSTCLYLKLSPQHLQKLTTFECRVFGGQSEVDGVMEFISLNPCIKKLKIGGSNLNRKLFDAIKFHLNLNHLELSYFRYDILEPELVNFPILSSITYLSISLRDLADNLDQIIEKLPNLSRIFIEMRYGSFDKLIDLASKLPKVKSLNLKMYYRRKHPIEIHLPKIDNLISLEFALNSFSAFAKVKLNLDACKSLKLVKFSADERQSAQYKSNLSPEFTSNWKAIHYYRSISYYRVNQ
jgi:hypothetical protein